MHYHQPPVVRHTLTVAFVIYYLASGLFPLFTAPFFVSPTAHAAPLEQGNTTGEPCGRGEQFPSWGVCLHGTVFDQAGLPIDGALITVARGERSLNTTSQRYPNENTPTYAIDIGALEADYLEEVTVTVTVGSMTLIRKLLVFPDYRTHNQQFDLHLGGTGAVADATLWGYVTDFGAHGPVAGAKVTASFQGATAMASTALVGAEPYPIFKFTAQTLASIGATAGTRVTLTAEVDGVRAQGEVVIGSAPQQVNLRTGWKCEAAEILPRSGGQFGVPRSGGQFGVPNEGCVWGYALVDGLPEAGVAILLEVDGVVVQQEPTKRFDDEQNPRYAILVQDADDLTGRSLTITASYNGITERRTVPLAFDEATSQRVDIAISGIGALEHHVNADEVRDLTVTDDALWVASTNGGVIRYDLASGVPIQYTVLDGLASNITTAAVLAVDRSGLAPLPKVSAG